MEFCIVQSTANEQIAGRAVDRFCAYASILRRAWLRIQSNKSAVSALNEIIVTATLREQELANSTGERIGHR